MELYGHKWIPIKCENFVQTLQMSRHEIKISFSIVYIQIGTTVRWSLSPRVAIVISRQ